VAPGPLGPLDQFNAIAIRVADEADPRAAFAHLIRRPLRLDALGGKLLERFVEVAHRKCDVPVAGAELIRVDAEVVGQLELGLVLARNAEEVIDRLVADRQLPTLLEAERLVERDRTLGVGDAVTGVEKFDVANSR
jgi:hypothetical protein